MLWAEAAPGSSNSREPNQLPGRPCKRLLWPLPHCRPASSTSRCSRPAPTRLVSWQLHTQRAQHSLAQSNPPDWQPPPLPITALLPTPPAAHCMACARAPLTVFKYPGPLGPCSPRLKRGGQLCGCPGGHLPDLAGLGRLLLCPRADLAAGHRRRGHHAGGAAVGLQGGCLLLGHDRQSAGAVAG